MAALSGSTAGILGLPTLYGFGFYAVSVFGKPYDIYFLLFFYFYFLALFISKMEKNLPILRENLSNQIKSRYNFPV